MKNRSKVALITCETYDVLAVDAAIEKGIALLGGIGMFVTPEEHILLKPNMLNGAPPEKAVTTHPTVFGGVGQFLKRNGYSHLSYGDSPGFHRGNVEEVAESCGMKQAAEALGISMADFDHGMSASFPAGKLAKEFVICNGVQAAEAIINICKMKTHGLERITGGVKNQLGCVQGFHKGMSHAKYPDPETFAKMLVDLNLFLKPRLHIMDGIVAMEGNGPNAGRPIPMGMILISEDPVALDSVFCHLISLSPKLVPTNVFGALAGLGVWEPEAIEVMTEQGTMTPMEAARSYGNPQFDVYRGDIRQGRIKNYEWLMRLVRQKPVILSERCVACGICVESCPVEGKAIHLKKEAGKVPQYNYQTCIRCFCCQEMCPMKAIEIKTPWLGRLLL